MLTIGGGAMCKPMWEVGILWAWKLVGCCAIVGLCTWLPLVLDTCAYFTGKRRWVRKGKRGQGELYKKYRKRVDWQWGGMCLPPSNIAQMKRPGTLTPNNMVLECQVWWEEWGIHLLDGWVWRWCWFWSKQYASRMVLVGWCPWEYIVLQVVQSWHCATLTCITLLTLLHLLLCQL